MLLLQHNKMIKKTRQGKTPVTDALFPLAHQAVLPVHRLGEGDRQLPRGVPAEYNVALSQCHLTVKQCQ